MRRATNMRQCTYIHDTWPECQQEIFPPSQKLEVGRLGAERGGGETWLNWAAATSTAGGALGKSTRIKGGKTSPMRIVRQHVTMSCCRILYAWAHFARSARRTSRSSQTFRRMWNGDCGRFLRLRPSRSCGKRRDALWDGRRCGFSIQTVLSHDKAKAAVPHARVAESRCAQQKPNSVSTAGPTGTAGRHPPAFFRSSLRDDALHVIRHRGDTSCD